MDRRIVAKGKIEYAFAFILARVKIANKLNFTDVNIVAEDFFKVLFNLLYEYDLRNANAIRQNESAIDLFYNTERIAYQITSQNKATKLTKTVNAFLKSNKQKSYSKFTIFSISAETKCSSNALEKLAEHNVESKYINVADLEREILTDIDTDKLELIADYLEYETNPHVKRKPVIPVKYDEKLKSIHIVDQLYHVLKSFDGFGLIYPRTLARIFPFNLDEKVYEPYSNYCLKTNNIAIHKLLQKVKVNEKYEIEINDEALKPFSEKLKEIFTILNNSLVRYICYREKYTEIEHHKISVLPYNPDCTCNQCKYQKFNTPSLFALLKEKSIKHSDELVDALSEGYYSCKLGEHIKGWQIFNSIAEKSKEQKKNVVHFLAQYNSYSIYNFVDSPWWENEAKAILPKIEEIDLHNVLCGLDVPLIVRDELIKVKEDYHLNYSREKIEEHAERIRAMKVLYANKGSSSGAASVILLGQELHLLFAYYTLNSIITDDFFTFRATMTKAIEAFFNSYTTDSRYEYKYKEFDNFVLTMMLFYVEEDSMKRIFKTYDIKKIEIAETEKKSFIKMMTNFFTSQVANQKHVGVKFNEDINRQEYFSHYRQLLRHLFNRAMLILSKVNLNSEELKPITQPFTDFLHAGEDVNHSSWEYATRFLSNCIQAFDEKQIKSIIELTLSEKYHRNANSSLEDICDSAAENANFTITDQAFFLKIFNLHSTPCSKNNRYHDMTKIFSLWNVADENGKLLIKQKAVEHLENKFDPDFYQHGVFNEVFNKHEHTNLLDQYISYAQNACHGFDLKEEKGHWIFHSYVGFNCMNCLSLLEIDFTEERIQVIAQKSDYYNWLVNYQNYDYSNFNCNWLTDACPYYLRMKLHKVETLKMRVASELAKDYNAELATFYVKHLMKAEEK